MKNENELTQTEYKDETVAGEGKPAATSAEQKSLKAARAKEIIRNVVLVAVVAVGIFSLLGVVKEIGYDAHATFGDVLSGANPLFSIVLVAVIFGIVVLDVVKFCIICKTVTGKVLLGASIKTNFIGRYYDAVTPFASGGQPMQIYYLNTKGISGGNSSAIVLIKYIFSIVCWIILGAGLMIYGAAQGVLEGISGGNILKITGWLGVGINLIIPVFVLLFLVLPKLMGKITVGVIRAGKKLKIVKDVEKSTERALKTVSDFKHSFKLMATSPFNFVLLVAVCFAESVLTFAVPYFVMRAFSCPVGGMWLVVASLNVYAIFGASFIPTPGSSGIIEGMGAIAFSVAAGAALIWSVVFWRLLTFYIYILIGLGITVSDIIRKNLRSRRARRLK